MQTTTMAGRPPAGNDFPVRFGDEPAPGRLPLRQRWQLLCADAATPNPAQWRAPRLARAQFVLVAQQAQGEIWALDEGALSEARRAVESAHPGGVRFMPAQVHTYVDPQRRVAMEPLMFVKVNACREQLDAVLRELRTRGARMQEVELHGRHAVVRAQARLRDLLGFRDFVSTLQPAPAKVFSRLVRYESAAEGGG